MTFSLEITQADGRRERVTIHSGATPVLEREAIVPPAPPPELVAHLPEPMPRRLVPAPANAALAPAIVMLGALPLAFAAFILVMWFVR